MTALKLTNWQCRTEAMTRARVVLPLPGGPQKIMEENSRPALRDRHNRRPAPTRCLWPTNSARVRARILAARGAGGAKSEGELSIKETSHSWACGRPVNYEKSSGAGVRARRFGSYFSRMAAAT